VIDIHPLVYGLAVISFVIALRLLLMHPGVRAAFGNAMRRLGERVADGLRQPPEFDQLADDLAKALRREKLRADVRRLERILANDMSMSACRQLGNRMAYDWLLRELDKSTRDISRPLAGHDFADSWVDNWNAPDPATVTRDFAGSQYASRTPQVEILEIGWKR
jgi:hypothetical protein